MTGEKPATIRRSTERVLFFDEADQELLDKAREKVAAEALKATLRQRRAGSADVGESEAVSAAQEELDALTSELSPRAVLAVTVQALKRGSYQDLMAKCPPGEKDKADGLPFDQRKLGDLLLEHFDGETGERTVIEPDFRSKADLVAWLSEFQDGDFSALFNAALKVNNTQRAAADPKASRT